MCNQQPVSAAMFAESHDDEEQKPRLELEYSGSGPGSRIKTAIGAGDDNSQIDPSVLPDPPWWFSFVDPRINYRSLFCTLPLEVALKLLEEVEVPPLYRLGLGFQWGFLDDRRDGFMRGDLAEIMRALGVLTGSLDKELAKIEKRSTYQIWRKRRGTLKLDIHEYWSNRPGLYS